MDFVKITTLIEVFFWGGGEERRGVVEERSGGGGGGQYSLHYPIYWGTLLRLPLGVSPLSKS